MPCLYAAAGTEDATGPDLPRRPARRGRDRRRRHRLPGGRGGRQRADRLPLDRRPRLLGRPAAAGPRPRPARARRARPAAGAPPARRRRRRRGRVRRVAEFVPGRGRAERVPGASATSGPGHVGTVADERVDPIDITATLVDLAVRGHLLITELPRASEFARDRLGAHPAGTGSDGLRPFEQALLDGIAPDGEPVRVSEIGGRVSGSRSARSRTRSTTRSWPTAGTSAGPTRPATAGPSSRSAALVVAVVVTVAAGRVHDLRPDRAGADRAGPRPGLRRAGDAGPDAEGRRPARRPGRAALGPAEPARPTRCRPAASSRSCRRCCRTRSCSAGRALARRPRGDRHRRRPRLRRT